MTAEVLLARDGDIATVTLSNPGRLNALKLRMWLRLGELLRALGEDDAVALEILLEGRVFGADEACEKGLLNRIVTDDDVMTEGHATARRIADGAPLVARWQKKFARRLAGPRPLAAQEQDECYACFDSEDYREVVAGFLARRKPEFRGR